MSDLSDPPNVVDLASVRAAAPPKLAVRDLVKTRTDRAGQG